MGRFVDDVVVTLRTLRRVPWLLPVALGVVLVTDVVSGIGSTPASPLVLLAPVWLVVEAGWVGTERIVVARDQRGEQLHARNVWAAVRILGPRFVRLGLVLAPACVPTVAVALASEPTSGVVRAVAAATVVVVGIPLTFVTSALALSTDRVRGALRIGWRLLRSSGTEVPGHVLVPPAVLAGLVLVAPVLGGVVASLLFAAVALVARGATTCRYAVLVDVSWPDVPGSVWRRRVAVG